MESDHLTAVPRPLLQRRLTRPTTLGRLAVGGGAAAALVTGLGPRLTAAHPAAPMATPAPPPGPDLVEPEEVVSKDGLLDVTLTARLGPAKVAGRDVITYVYNHSFPGPTMRIHPGDRLRVKLVNQLPDMPTNLHVHGFHVSPSGNSDNVFLHIMPGETFQFEFDTPTDHAPGLYWYHPHPHGYSELQVYGGMAGGIVNVGPFDDLPGIAGLKERVLLIQISAFRADGHLLPLEEVTAAPTPYYVNGQVNPTIRIRPGETQRWRIGNISADFFVNLHLDGHVMHETMADANPQDRPVPQNAIVLGPAERTEVLVQAGAPGTYQFKTLPFGPGLQATPEVLLATMVVEGEPVTSTPLPTELVPFLDLRTVPVDRTRELEFQMVPQPDGTFKDQISGQQFDPDVVNQVVQLGATEEWTISNATEFWHPFHIHVNEFQVVALNGQPYEAHGYEDTFPVPPHGSFTMRIRFTDFTGRFVYHCHILAHEDGGMMGVVEVVE